MSDDIFCLIIFIVLWGILYVVDAHRIEVLDKRLKALEEEKDIKNQEPANAVIIDLDGNEHSLDSRMNETLSVLNRIDNILYDPTVYAAILKNQLVIMECLKNKGKEAISNGKGD